MFYPQNGDPIVTIDSVTSLHPMYTLTYSLTYLLKHDAVPLSPAAYRPVAVAGPRMLSNSRPICSRALLTAATTEQTMLPFTQKTSQSTFHSRLMFRFLIIFTERCYASAVLAMGLCPCVSVCSSVSVTSRSSTKTAKRRITPTTPHDSPGSLVF